MTDQERLKKELEVLTSLEGGESSHLIPPFTSLDIKLFLFASNSNEDRISDREKKEIINDLKQTIESHSFSLSGSDKKEYSALLDKYPINSQDIPFWLLMVKFPWNWGTKIEPTEATSQRWGEEINIMIKRAEQNESK